MRPFSDPKSNPSPQHNPKTPLQSVAKPLQNAEKQKDGQSPVQDETALKSKIFGLSRLEGEIASIIAETFAGEIAKGEGGNLARSSQSPQSAEPETSREEITQEDAERLYEEMMSK